MIVLYQDNETTIRLEQNGVKSSTRRTRHMDLKCLNMKDKVKKNKIGVVHCPTERFMVADFLTKPLQGSLFGEVKEYVYDRH